MKKPLIITTGDADGIGPEVVSKALLKLKKLDRPFVITGQTTLPQWKKLQKQFHIQLISSWSDIHYPVKKNYFLLNPWITPQKFVEAAAIGCMQKKFSAIATGPMSKTRFMGHTEILKKVSGKEELYMSFVGNYFSVVSATGHIPLKKVSQNLTLPRLKKALLQTQQFAKKMKGAKPIALLGLNPHAGENGLIGDEEQAILKPLLAWAKKSRINVVGPLPPDTAFTKEMQQRFSVYLGLYHDQALIPFKAIHGFEDGIQLTLGLPFTRTSVDHGTAKDLVGKNKAQPESMLKAIQWACRLG